MDVSVTCASKDALRVVGIDGDTHDAVHNVPLTRLVFVPKDDGRLYRCAIDAIEASNGITGGGVETEGAPGHNSTDDAGREAAA